LVVARRPDALLHPQFFAEDGVVFYQQAYNGGVWKALLTPVAGYYDTISRLGTAVAMLFPLRAAPLIFNVLAIGIQILPVWFLNTSRFDALLPDARMRLVLSFLYLGLPNSQETNATLTNALWHSALLAPMIILAGESRSLLWRAFDLIALTISGLSGPFCLLLLPTAGLAWFYTRRRWSLALLGVTLVTAGIQVYSLISVVGFNSRSPAPLGVGPVALARIVGGQVFLGSILGENGYALVYQKTWWTAGVVAPLLVAGAGTLVMIYVAWKSNLALRLFMLYSLIAFFAALFSPMASETSAQWPLLAGPGIGARYYLMPMLAWVMCLVWLVWPNRKYRILNVLGGGVLAVMILVGIPIDWSYPGFVDYQFSTYVTQFEQAPAGKDVTIPINPPNWTMVLHKR
jgi:hypothetical protein